MLGAITIDKLAEIFFVSHRVKIILKITVNFVSCDTFSYAILILIFIDISTFLYFCKTLQDVFRNIFVPKKINTVARQTIVLYYDGWSPSQNWPVYDSIIAPPHRDYVFKRNACFILPVLFVFSRRRRRVPNRHTNEWRTNVFLKLVSTVAIIRTHWDARRA